MKRIYELLAEIRKQFPNDDFFKDFTLDDKSQRKAYRAYHDALKIVDDKSWLILKKKALKHYQDERPGQRKQGFFNLLNEAFAYRYLIRKGFKNVRFIKEGKSKSPDISFDERNVQSYCEVKTLGISDDEKKRRNSGLVYDGSVYVNLSDGFLKKLSEDVKSAQTQINSFGKNAEKCLIFIIIRFDDFTLAHYQNYRKQLIKFSRDRGFNNLVMKIGTLGRKRICIASRRK